MKYGHGPLPAGKLPAGLLRDLLSNLPDCADVILGPGIGRDVAVLDPGAGLLVAKSDPITFATDEIGWYAVHVNANDLASAGATPRWFLVTLLLPAGETDPALVIRIMDDLREAADGLGVALVGGHTEITVGIDRPIVCGTMLGSVSADDLVRPDGIRPGDEILLTNGMAVETTAIVAREMPEVLRDAGFSDADIERAVEYLRDPGISVTEHSRIARSAGDIHAMHDATEGGLATALPELSEASGVTLRVRRDVLESAISPLARRVCEAVDIDPLGTISSGCLIIVVSPETVDDVADALGEAGIDVFRVGNAVDGPTCCEYVDGTPWPVFDRDEIARLFEGNA